MFEGRLFFREMPKVDGEYPTSIHFVGPQQGVICEFDDGTNVELLTHVTDTGLIGALARIQELEAENAALRAAS